MSTLTNKAEGEVAASMAASPSQLGSHATPQLYRRTRSLWLGLKGVLLPRRDSPAAVLDDAPSVRRWLRLGAILLLVFQACYISADFVAKSAQARTLLPFHLVNIAILSSVLGFTFLRSFEIAWRAMVLVACAALIAMGTYMSVLSQDVEPRFISVLLFSIGSAAFVPWGPLWQAGMNLVCLSSFAIDAVYVQFRDQYTVYRWVGLLLALFLAQFTASFLEHYRRNLRAKILQLEQAAQSRERQIAMMGHDIRSPLAIITGFLNLLEEPGFDEEQKADMRGRIGSAIRAIDALVANLLDLYRLEEGKLSVQKRVVNPNTIISQVADNYAKEARRKGLTLTTELRELPPGAIDPLQLERMLVNLVTNAIKYTRQGGVKLSTELENGSLRVSVEDTGVGIAGEALANLFTRFYRPNTHENSVGLGLYISQALARANGGTITVVSRLGEGSRFTLELPFVAAAAAN